MLALLECTKRHQVGESMIKGIIAMLKLYEYLLYYCNGEAVEQG